MEPLHTLHNINDEVMNLTCNDKTKHYHAITQQPSHVQTVGWPWGQSSMVYIMRQCYIYSYIVL